MVTSPRHHSSNDAKMRALPTQLDQMNTQPALTRIDGFGFGVMFGKYLVGVAVLHALLCERNYVR